MDPCTSGLLPWLKGLFINVKPPGSTTSMFIATPPLAVSACDAIATSAKMVYLGIVNSLVPAVHLSRFPGESRQDA